LSQELFESQRAYRTECEEFASIRDALASALVETRTYREEVGAFKMQMNSISEANNQAQEEFRLMVIDRDVREVFHKSEATQAEARYIKLKAESAQETLSALQAQASDGHASVQELEMNAQRRADDAFNAFKADVQREALVIISEGVTHYEKCAAESAEHSLKMSDEVHEYYAEARTAVHAEQNVDRLLARARAESQQRLLDKDSWIESHRQLSHDTQVADRELRLEARAALAEQQALHTGQMASNTQAIMKEVEREWQTNHGHFEMKIEELSTALSKARTETIAYNGGRGSGVAGAPLPSGESLGTISVQIGLTRMSSCICILCHRPKSMNFRTR
jgi:hypothetical protein